MNLEPTGRGADPDTRTTVATATFLPSATQSSRMLELVLHTWLRSKCTPTDAAVDRYRFQQPDHRREIGEVGRR